ncbi:MAG TPA: aminotransferase class V-fold PLP-dependent enzyme [Nitrososphaeraceae archaeon]|nr:aminotransferase class V-fold PLP-dependent enzyme [Nitrososphaeraceae archaeon]
MEYTDEAISDLVYGDFPLTKKKIYMNNGSIAPTPISTIKAITDTFLKYSIEGPDSKVVNEFVTSLTTELRSRIAVLINCEPEEIIFTQSTTEGLNYVRNGIEWKKGDSIIVRGGTHEHYANYLPWLQLSREKGVNLIDLPINDSGYFDIAELEDFASREPNPGAKKRTSEKQMKPKLITLSHALYNNGAIMPIEQVGKITRENNVLFCIDAAQTVGSLEIDVKKIGCDFMAFPAFKWLCGPLGLGVLYCSKRVAETLKPDSIGSESATLSSDQKILAYLEPPLKFQTGFRNFPALAGLEASIRYLLRLGIGNIRRKNIKVANTLRRGLEKITDVKVYGPEDDYLRTSIISFSSKKMSSKSVVDKLEQNEIIFAERDVGGGTKAARASPHFFNSEGEATRAVEYIKNILK